MNDWPTLEGNWRVLLGDELVGEIAVTEPDFPWLQGSFEAGPAYPRVASLFAQEWAATESEDWATADAAYERLHDLGLRVLRPDGTAVAEVLLHIDGPDAWFRWSDEPFAK